MNGLHYSIQYLGRSRRDKMLKAMLRQEGANVTECMSGMDQWLQKTHLNTARKWLVAVRGEGGQGSQTQLSGKIWDQGGGGVGRCVCSVVGVCRQVQ